MNDLRTLVRIQLAVILSFGLCKLVLRRLILLRVEGGFWEVFLLSYPNFCEAVVGTLGLAGLGLLLGRRVGLEGTRSQRELTYAGVTVLAGLYVVSQELGIHRLGGTNVTDPWDVISSILGLAASYGLLRWLQPRIEAI